MSPYSQLKLSLLKLNSQLPSVCNLSLYAQMYFSLPDTMLQGWLQRSMLQCRLSKNTLSQARCGNSKDGICEKVSICKTTTLRSTVSDSCMLSEVPHLMMLLHSH